MMTNINIAFIPAHAKQHVSIGFPLAGTDHRLATATAIGCGADFPDAAPFSITFGYATLRQS